MKKNFTYVLKSHGLQATTTQPQQISSDTIAARLTFAYEHDKKLDFWPKVVFSDESDLLPYKSGKLFIRRRKGEYPLSYYNINSRLDRRTIN